jgi:hypothetical protein
MDLIFFYTKSTMKSTFIHYHIVYVEPFMLSYPKSLYTSVHLRIKIRLKNKKNPLLLAHLKKVRHNIHDLYRCFVPRST